MADAKKTGVGGFMAGFLRKTGEPSAEDVAEFERTSSGTTPVPRATRRGLGTPPPVTVPSDGTPDAVDPTSALSADFETIMANHKVPDDPKVKQVLTFFGTVASLDPATKRTVVGGVLQSFQADPTLIGQVLAAQLQALSDEVATQDRGAVGRQRARDERLQSLKQAAEARIAEYTRQIQELQAGIQQEDASVRSTKASEDAAVAAFKTRAGQMAQSRTALAEFLRTITPNQGK